MGHRPVGLTLERINNRGNYEPSNCKWATKKEQGRNTCKNKMITYGGETKCMSEWAEYYGINYQTLKTRVRVKGIYFAMDLSRKEHEQRIR
jgi:hypothetical protein